MDEIEYKLKTNNSVLIVNAVDKLISTIRFKFKLAERQKFVVENEELKFLREKCSSEDSLVSLTACQGLLALVQLGVLEIGHTMSTVVTLLPSAHNYSAIISTIAGLLTLDLKARLVPGQPYTCQFSLTSPKHPFITVLERNKDAKDEVISQMHAMCVHPDYVLELLRPVFLWLTCAGPAVSPRPWRLLVSLPPGAALTDLLLACLSCQQTCNPEHIESAFAAYSAVGEAAVYQARTDTEWLVALLPMLARVSNELVRYGRDPRSCYSLMERCLAAEAPELISAAPLTLSLLAANLIHSSALHLHELFNLCLNIITKYECSSLSTNMLVSLSLQWLHLPSYLTTSALKVASKIIELYQQNEREDSRLYMANLIKNKTFEALLYTDGHLTLIFKLHEQWERVRDDPVKLNGWFEDLNEVNDEVKLEIVPFFLGIVLMKYKDVRFEEVVVRSVGVLTDLVRVKKEVSVQVLPVLLYKFANDVSPNVKLACLRALPVMAMTKENVPTIVAILSKLKTNKGVPTSFLIMLYTSLAETQVRCFPYLQELVVEPGAGRADDLRWETDIARALAVRRICEIRASSHGLELVSVISSILVKCTDRAGSAATSLALQALVHLWKEGVVAPPSTWRALEPKLGRDTRPMVQISICKLLSAVPSLRVSLPEYAALTVSAARRLWGLVAECGPDVALAACAALANYRVDDYRLADVPEIYRRTVTLPASYCKTPADAARRPEDVLDYIPCEVWPEVFKYTNQSALDGVVLLTSRLMEREIRAYRSGVYAGGVGGAEPRDASYLPAASVVRGLLDCFRKQATSPSYDWPEATLLHMLSALTAEFPKPLPPLELCFLHELFHRGEGWRGGSVRLAARQANTSGSARRFLENYLQGLGGIEPIQESDVLVVYEALPILCRAMPPNTLRPILDKTLSQSYAKIAHIKTKDKEYIKDFKIKDEETKHAFIEQLYVIKQCLDCDKIHDANRTLLAQTVEKYFTVIPDDNVAWAHYAAVSSSLPAAYLERMTSPSGWWEADGPALGKACEVRCIVALASPTPLVWLNEIIDATATCYSEHDHSLRCMAAVFRAARVEDKSTSEWLLQLLARTQAAFKELEDEPAKLYLWSVLALCVCVWSGAVGVVGGGVGVGGVRLGGEGVGLGGDMWLFPRAVATLCASPHFSGCALQLLEWVRHTRDALRDVTAAVCCARALRAARHAPPAVANNMWKRLESNVSRSIRVEE